MSRGYNPLAKPSLNNSNGVSKTNDGTSNLISLIGKFESEIKRVLPKHITAERMTRIIISEVRRNPKLAECSQISFFSAVMFCSQMGLEPGSGLGLVHLIPYWNSKAQSHEVQIIIGYQGLIDLMERPGNVRISAGLIFEKDTFKIQKGSKEELTIHPYFGKESHGDLLGAYAVANYSDGSSKFEVMSIAEIIDIMKKTKSKGEYGPWKDHFGEMAKKTAIRRLAKIIPKSPELAKIDRHDDSIDIESTNTTSFHKEVLEDISLPPGLIEALETTDAENQIAADPSEEA